MAGVQTLPSRQRARVLDAYRGRGHRNSNLWLVYSVKEDQDLLLHSDRSLVHWLAFLESDPSVAGFRPIPDELSAVLKVAPAAAMILERKDRQLEVHTLADQSPELATIETCAGPAAVRVIAPGELQARARLAARWLKAVGYAGLYRYKDLTPVTNQLTPAFMRRWRGTVNELVDDLAGLDRAAIFAGVVKAAIGGHIELDLSSHGLCGTSGWKWTGWQSR